MFRSEVQSSGLIKSQANLILVDRRPESTPQPAIDSNDQVSAVCLSPSGPFSKASHGNMGGGESVSAEQSTGLRQSKT
jgi:hypothetical protein